MKKYEVKNHEPSFLPDDSEWELVWADEFDGTELDTTKWNFRLDFWGEKFDAYTDKGVVLDGNSHLELHRTEIDGRYVSPQLQTGTNSFDHLIGKQSENPWGEDGLWPFDELKEPKFVHRYGYYECRCKFQKDPKTMWSAFWIQSPTIGARFEPEWCGIESDIMEHNWPGIASCGNIMGGYGKQFKEDGRIIYDIEEENWHYFGLDWRENGYTFYLDGKEISRACEHVSHVPQFILLTTEVKGYRSVNKSKDSDETPPFVIQGDFIDDAFVVDFVRVFDRIK